MRWSIAVAVLVAGGCNGPASVDVTPERPLITSKAGTVQLEVTVKDKGGKVLSDVPVTYSSLTPTMASVDGAGVVRPLTSGMATILVSAGEASKQVAVLIQIAKRIDIAPPERRMMVGVTRGYKGTVYDDRDEPMIAGEIKWSTTDPAIITVDSHGNVKSLTEGTAELVAEAAGISERAEIVVKHEEVHEDGTLSQ